MPGAGEELDGAGASGEGAGGPPWILGWRGLPTDAPENTLAGFRRGMAAGLDGFHYDDAILRDAGRLARKGAPDTFDVGGLRAALDRLEGRDGGVVAVPVFDRDLEISRGSARLIAPEARLILVEGNYLLLSTPPWNELRRYFDLTVMIEVPEPELQRRLRERWEGYGLTEAEMDAKLEQNDLPNGRTVRSMSIPADLVLRSGAG